MKLRVHPVRMLECLFFGVLNLPARFAIPSFFLHLIKNPLYSFMIYVQDQILKIKSLTKNWPYLTKKCNFRVFFINLSGCHWLFNLKLIEKPNFVYWFWRRLISGQNVIDYKLRWKITGINLRMSSISIAVSSLGPWIGCGAPFACATFVSVPNQLCALNAHPKETCKQGSKICWFIFLFVASQ